MPGPPSSLPDHIPAEDHDDLGYRHPELPTEPFKPSGLFGEYKLPGVVARSYPPCLSIEQGYTAALYAARRYTEERDNVERPPDSHRYIRRFYLLDDNEAPPIRHHRSGLQNTNPESPVNLFDSSDDSSDDERLRSS